MQAAQAVATPEAGVLALPEAEPEALLSLLAEPLLAPVTKLAATLAEPAAKAARAVKAVADAKQGA